MITDIDITPLFAVTGIIDIWANIQFVEGKGFILSWGDGICTWEETFERMSEATARAALMLYCGERTWYANFRQTEHGFRTAINNFFVDNTDYD